MRNGQCTTPRPARRGPRVAPRALRTADRALRIAPRALRIAHRGPRTADLPRWTLRVLALVLAMGVAGSVARAEVIDRILAVVARELITLSDVTAAIRLGLVGQATGQDAIRAGLDTLIARQLELSEANRYQPPEPAPAQVSDRLSAVRDRFPTPAAFTQTLAQSGLSEEQLRLRLRDDLRIEAYLAQRFGTTRQPSDPELVDYYRTHESEFTGPAGLRPFADVREEVRTRVTAVQRATQMADWLEGLRRRTEVTDLYVVAK